MRCGRRNRESTADCDPREICDAEVNETYLQYLVELHKKIQFVTGKSDDIAAKKDVEPELEKLKLRAVAKIREFLLNKVYSLRKPKTNVQIIQQNILIKYKYDRLHS